MILGAGKFWILDPLYNMLGGVLAAFYAVVPSYGFAIVFLTMTVRLMLFPLTAKQVKSQQAMQRVQPEMKRLQAKYKGDRVKLNEEMMKLYKEHKVNPLAGCLPILLQMPLFIVLYRLILSLSDKDGPKHIPIDSSLFNSLTADGGKLQSFGMDLADKASSVQGFGKAIPFYVLIVLVMATGYFQQRQVMARTPKEAINPQMAMMGKVFPAFFGLISLSIPAGVVVYFLVSNMWQIGQQALAFRHQDKAGLSAPAKRDREEEDGDEASPRSGRESRANRDSKAAKSSRTPRAQSGRVTPPKAARGSSKGGGRSKGRRPPPSPRPKGLPSSAAGNARRKPKGKGS